ncbi:MAG TPA: glycosyltransferase family 2 protein [Candidatus Nanoarchaeia archaeon]|nr:glycosyltransferase family 2 protein [Candidatus Nanoarchaeia archaeon]
MEKVSCIIPAYNEEKRIKKVIEAVINNKFVDELIVVNDGSYDKTKEIIESQKKKYKKLKIINNNPNIGKSASVGKGIKAAKNDLVMLIDADLINLNEKNITDLVKPVIENKAKVSISLRKNYVLIHRIMGINYFLLNVLKIDIVSGERVFNRKIIKNLDELNHIQGYELEVFINKIIIKKKLNLKVVKWSNVYTPQKTEKYGFIVGIKTDIKMIEQIISSIGLVGLKDQFIELKKLMIK